MRQVLLDRDGELGALAREVALVRAGAGRVIVVEGPAGIGKSSLLATVARSAPADGVAVLGARGGPLDQDAAWGVARQLFEPLRAGAAWSEMAVGAARLAQRALDPEVDEPARGGDAMHAAARGLVWLVTNLAARTPALLVVDDVHWADAPSLRWLAQLARGLDGLALAVLCAVRAGEPPADPELLAELLAAAPGPPLRPRSLGPAAAEALVGEHLPAADASFAHACHAVTAGNPFLLGALLAQLVAENVAPSDDVALRLHAFGSEQVARSVERRLSRLPDGAGALARAVAVLGRGTPLRHAARLARLALPDATRVADALRAAGLFDDGDELALAHPLVEAALYRSLGRGERALWHADAAQLLVRERADPERVALHLLRTEPAADPTAVSTRARQRPARARAGHPRTRPPCCVARCPSRRSMPPPTPSRASNSGSRWPRTCNPTPRACCTTPSSTPPPPGSEARSRCAAPAHSGWPGTSVTRSRCASARSPRRATHPPPRSPASRPSSSPTHGCAPTPTPRLTSACATRPSIPHRCRCGGSTPPWPARSPADPPATRWNSWPPCSSATRSPTTPTRSSAP